MQLTRQETATPWWDGFIDEDGAPYGRSEAGNVNFTNLSSKYLGQQSQYGSRYVDGILPEYPNLSTGLTVEGSSSEYHELAVSPEDANELMERIIAYRGLHIQITYNQDTHSFDRIDDARREEFVAFLSQRGLPLPYGN